MKIFQTGVGPIVGVDRAVRDTQGSGLLPMQVEVTGTATYRVVARVSPEAPWQEIRASDTVGFLESVSWVPYVGIEVTAGTGTVELWIGDR